MFIKKKNVVTQLCYETTPLLTHTDMEQQLREAWLNFKQNSRETIYLKYDRNASKPKT